MKKISLLTFGIVLFIICITSCEKDDICAEETPTTPQLVIRLFDIASPNDTKTAAGLFAYGLDDMDNQILINNLEISTTDSIAIPLRTDVNSTRFALHLNYEVDDNDTPDDTTDDFFLGNPDIITVNYDREDIYVSRACGFKTIFNNFSFSVGLDAENWIINSEIILTNVENENAAHVKIFH